jgi:putative tryptophan/tyrosine transport system substrate-binding protein
VDQSTEKDMKKITVVSLCAMLLALGFSAQAQQSAGKIPRIGFLSRELHPSDSRAAGAPGLEAFRQGLRELGYVEDKTIVIEQRYAEARPERLPALAEELVRLKVEIIVADQTLVARAARKVTSTIPIVFLTGSDPVQSGLAASLARPGGNVTGLTNQAGELRGKRLELMKEVVPKVSRFALLEGTGGSAANKANIAAAQKDAQALGITLRVVEIKADNPDFDGAFRVMAKERIGGLIIGTGSIIGISLHRKKILELVEQNRIPAIYGSPGFIEDGGLMFYGVNEQDLARRGAILVDKILKGADPANLPVERPTKFELVINLKAAKKIDLTIPPNVLARADRVIR